MFASVITGVGCVTEQLRYSLFGGGGALLTCRLIIVQEEL